MGCSSSKRVKVISDFEPGHDFVHGRPIIQGHIEEQNHVSINCGKIKMKINVDDKIVSISNQGDSIINMKGYQPAAKVLLSSIRAAKNAESDQLLHQVELYSSGVCILTFSLWNTAHSTDEDIINDMVTLISSFLYKC